MSANNRKNPFLLAPASALAVLVLLLVFGFAEGDGGIRTSVLTMLFVLLAFGLVLVVFTLLRTEKRTLVFPLKKQTRTDVSLTIFALFSLIWLQTVLKYALLRRDFDYKTITLYGFSASFPENLPEMLLVLLSFVWIPAVMEEFFFRGAIFYEYRLAGVTSSILMSSLFSAMMGLSFSAFPDLFLSAIVFATVRFLTGNLRSTIWMRILYGLYTLFLEKYVWLMSESSESRVLFTFLSVMLFGISCYFFLFFAEKKLRERGNAKEEAPVTVSGQKKIRMLWHLMTAPPLWILIFAYLVIAVVRIFVTERSL